MKTADEIEEQPEPVIPPKEKKAIISRAAAGLAEMKKLKIHSRAIQIFEYALKQAIEHDNVRYILACDNMRDIPVTIDEFIESPSFLAHDPDFKVWPMLREDLRRMNPDIWTGEAHIHQTFDGGATSTGKTLKATVTQLFQLYTLCCFEKPVKLWPRLSSNTPLIFAFQSVQERVTKRVIYEPFRAMFLSIPWVQENVTWDKDKDNVLALDNGIQVIPILAALTNIVGQAIVSALLDEINFMAVVEESKQITGARGQGGRFDQAQIIYSNITRRRKSRFVTKGPSPGCISVLSSVRYLGDFMDTRVKQIIANEEKGIYMMRHAQYEVQPRSDYSGKKFKLLVGRTEYGTRVLKRDELEGVSYPMGATVKLIPIEYLDDFKADPEGSLRDVCGIATDVISPFITQRHKIIEAIVRGKEAGMKPWVVQADIELGNDELGGAAMPQIIEENLPRDKDKPRFVHIDLSLTGDRCGIAIVKVLGHVAVRGVGDTVQNLPHYVLEQGITIKPSAAHELDFEAIRTWIINLKDHYGINIHTVSYDSFQSAESMQLMRKAGIQSWKVSADLTMEPYNYFKQCLYSGRINMQDHEILKVELAGLEINAAKGKVDHPKRLSKDLSDALVCAMYSASQNRDVRADTGVQEMNQVLMRNGRRVVTQRTRSPNRRVNRMSAEEAANSGGTYIGG